MPMPAPPHRCWAFAAPLPADNTEDPFDPGRACPAPGGVVGALTAPPAVDDESSTEAEIGGRRPLPQPPRQRPPCDPLF